MISIRDVSFRYPGARANALERVNLDIDEGQIVVVAGDSGSGKSTLARALIGAVPHLTGGTFEGAVLVAGRDTRREPPRALADLIGFVDQDPEAQGVVDRVEDEIVFGMENLGIDPVTMRKRLEEVLDALGLTSLRDARLGRLSGGERQRVAIGAALGTQPAFLVLDEPTSQLDPQSAEEVLGVLQRLNADLGMTIVVIEHRLERVVQYADRTVVMARGRIVADGEPRAVLASGAASTPLSRLARGLGWERVPLTVREGRAVAAGLRATLVPRARTEPAPGALRVRARSMTVARGGADRVRDVDLSVHGGETLAVVGRNGSGKTTLLRALIGLLPVRAGSREIAGSDPARVPVERIAERVAYLPQSADLLLFAETVRDEIAFTLRARAPGSDPDEVIARAGLTAFAETNPRDLSAGERLRAAFLAATAGDPEVVLLDEPTRGMDAAGKDRLVAELEAWRALDRAVVLVTHDVELVARVATRVVMLSDGRVIVDGPVREVLGESALFSSQMNKVFSDRRIATVEDVLEAVPT